MTKTRDRTNPNRRNDCETVRRAHAHPLLSKKHHFEPTTWLTSLGVCFEILFTNMDMNAQKYTSYCSPRNLSSSRKGGGLLFLASTTLTTTSCVRAAELTSVARSAARWQQKRCLARFIGRLCDRLFDRTSTRPRKNQLPSQHQPSMTASEREELRRRLMEVRRQRREAPTVVFFGDASYGPSMQGHNAIPKKGLLRELCHRGLTFLLDEYKTPKMCPCGHDELKTTG